MTLRLKWKHPVEQFRDLIHPFLECSELLDCAENHFHRGLLLRFGKSLRNSAPAICPELATTSLDLRKSQSIATTRCNTSMRLSSFPMGDGPARLAVLRILPTALSRHWRARSTEQFKKS